VALLYIGRLLSKGKMLFSISQPEKTNKYFGTKLARRDYVGKVFNSYIGRLFSKRKMPFSTSRPGKTNEYFEPNLAGVITSVLQTH